MAKITTFVLPTAAAASTPAARPTAPAPAPAALGWFSVTTTHGEMAVQATSFRQAVRAALARRRGAEVVSRPDGRPSVHRVSAGNARRIALTGAKRRWRDVDARVTTLINRLADADLGEGTLEACNLLVEGARLFKAVAEATARDLPAEVEEAIRLAPRRRQGEVRLAARLLLRQRAVSAAADLGPVVDKLEAWAEEGEALLGRQVSRAIMAAAAERAAAKAARKAAEAAATVAARRAEALAAAEAAKAEAREAAAAEAAAFDGAMARLFALLG